MELLNLFIGISSIVLAVVSIVLSLYFYSQSNKTFNRALELSKDIDNATKNLQTLFDKHFSSQFDLIKSHMVTYQEHFTGKMGSKSPVDYTLEVVSMIRSKGSVPFSQLCIECNFDKKILEDTLKKLEEKNLIDRDDDYISMKTNKSVASSNTDDFVGV